MLELIIALYLLIGAVWGGTLVFLDRRDGSQDYEKVIEFVSMTLIWPVILIGLVVEHFQKDRAPAV
jgi:hypothetical protein